MIKINEKINKNLVDIQNNNILNMLINIYVVNNAII